MMIARARGEPRMQRQMLHVCWGGAGGRPWRLLRRPLRVSIGASYALSPAVHEHVGLFWRKMPTGPGNRGSTKPYASQEPGSCFAHCLRIVFSRLGLIYMTTIYSRFIYPRVSVT